MSYKLAQLTLAASKKTNNIVGDIFVAQPDALKKSLAGQLFVLVEIENINKNSLKIIQFLINDINCNYYQNEKILLREKITSLKVEHIFETALAKTNKNLEEYILNEKIKINLGSINITAGVIYNDMLHFSSAGKNKALFICQSKKNKESASAKNSAQEKKSLPVENYYKIINITKQSEAEISKQKSVSKLFSNVISGRFPQGSHFIFANEALPEYISGKQLIKIITALPPAGAAEQIKNALSKINSYVPFLGLIIKNPIQKETRPKTTALSSSESSIINLNKTEDNTESLLTPSGIINPKKWLKSLGAIFAKKNFGPSAETKKNLIIKDKIFVKRKSFFYLFVKKIRMLLARVFIYPAGLILFLIKSFSRKKNINEPLVGFKEKILKISKKTASIFKNLNKKNKILLIIAMIFILLFAANVSRIKMENKKQEKQNKYENLIKSIEQKQNQAEASLLYGNEEGAKKLFSGIEDLLKKFPQDTEEQKGQYSEFNKKFNAQLEKVRRITRVDNPPKLADFANLNAEARPDNIIFIPETGKIYAADSSQKSIYILDTADNMATVVANFSQPITGLKSPALAKNNSIYYFNNGSIIEFNTENENIKSLLLPSQDEPLDFVDADAYGNKLYLLDSQAGQIFKYQRSGQKFLAPRAWLAEKISSGEAIDISIDGNIYILNKNGKIMKFLKGQKHDFSLGAIDPILKNPTKLFVSSELEYIYILEASNNRLAVFGKDGKFLMQYQSDVIANANDFAVDEKNKIIYILNNSSIFGIEAAHFEK